MARILDKYELKATHIQQRSSYSDRKKSHHFFTPFLDFLCKVEQSPFIQLLKIAKNFLMTLWTKSSVHECDWNWLHDKVKVRTHQWVLLCRKKFPYSSFYLYQSCIVDMSNRQSFITKMWLFSSTNAAKTFYALLPLRRDFWVFMKCFFLWWITENPRESCKYPCELKPLSMKNSKEQ